MDTLECPAFEIQRVVNACHYRQRDKHVLCVHWPAVLLSSVAPQSLLCCMAYLSGFLRSVASHCAILRGLATLPFFLSQRSATRLQISCMGSLVDQAHACWPLAFLCWPSALLVFKQRWTKLKLPGMNKNLHIWTERNGQTGRKRKPIIEKIYLFHNLHY
jgi:hypothetical protein